MSAVIWLTLFFLGFCYEMLALASSTDSNYPLTYYIRRLIRRPSLWVLAAGFWGWVAWHFFVVKP